LITERGEHIATISPKPKAAEKETFDELLDQLEKQGLIRHGRGKIAQGSCDEKQGRKANPHK
jgi:hypothetical protein